jgi:gamma-glutamyltranspeptidase/glutathione hydrolase
MFYLNSERPNALAGHKRPRATLTPSLVTRDGEPYMVFGTPGGDTQDQVMVQFFLNVVEFGMNIQQALDAPVVYSRHFPSSFYPRGAFPGHMTTDARIPSGVIAGLERRGHIVDQAEAWLGGKPMAIVLDRKAGVISGAVSAKGNIGYALGW